MTTGHVPFTCERFDERLPDYLEGTIDGAALADCVAHLSGCLRCSALVRDLDAIGRDAAALPELAPSRDLWAGIADRIEAPVVALAAAPTAHAASRRPAGIVIPRAWLGALAAGLVAATAGLTYMITAARMGGSAPVQVALAPSESGARGPASTDTTSAAAPAPRTDTASSPATVAAAPAARREESSAIGTPDPGPRTPPQSGARTSLAAERRAPSATTTYDREIEALRTIVRDRSPELDPKTLAILDNSLRTIDQAIAESRAAMERDPGSRFLRQQLNLALDKKLELLRTAAMLRRS